MGRGRNQSGTSGSSKKIVKSKPGAILMEKDDQESSDEITLPQGSRITRRRLTLAKEQSEKDKTSKIEAISTSPSTPIMNTNVDAAAPSRGRQRGRPRKHLNKSTPNLINISSSIESEVLDSENTASTEDMPTVNSDEMFIDNINNVENVVEISDYSQIANTLVENSDSDDKQTITMPDKMQNFETGSYALSSLDDDSQSQSDSVLAQQDENSNNSEEEYVVAQAESPVSQEEINLDNSHDQTSKINPSLYAFASPPHGNKQNEETVRDLSSESTEKMQSPIPTSSLAKSSLSHRNTPTPDRIVSSPEILHVRTNLKAPRTYQNKRRGKSISSTKGQKESDESLTKNEYPIAIFQSQDKSNIIQDKSSGQDTLSIATECRRSQRNRIIKYDIRDLLNKNRRSKIQIESKVVLKPKSDTSSPSLSSNVSSSLSSKDKSSEEYDTDRSSYLDSPQIFKGFSDSDSSKNSPITIKEKITSPQKRTSPVRSNTIQKKEISIQTDLDVRNKKEIGIELSSYSGQTVTSLLSGVTQKEKTEVTKTGKTLLSRQSCDERSLQSSFSALGESSKNNPIIHKKTRSEVACSRAPVRHLRPSVSKTVAPAVIEILNDEDSSEDERELRPIMDFHKKPTRTQQIFSKCLKRSRRVESLIESQIKPQRSLISNKFHNTYEPPKPIPINHCEENVINLIDDTSNESTSSPEILETTKQKSDEPDENKVEKYEEVRDVESLDDTVIVVEVQDDDDSVEEIVPEKDMETGGTKTDTSVSQLLDCSKEIDLSTENKQEPGKTRSRRLKQCIELDKAESRDKDGNINIKANDDGAEHLKAVEDAIAQMEGISNEVSSPYNETVSKNNIQECHTQSEPLFQEAEKYQKTSTIDTVHQDAEEIPQKVKSLKSSDDEQKLVSKPAKERPSRKSKIESESRERIEHVEEKKEVDELSQNIEEKIEKEKILKSTNSGKILIKRRGRQRKINLGSNSETIKCTEEDKEKRSFPKYEEDSSSSSLVFEIRKELEETVAEEKEIIEKQSAEKISEMNKPRKTRSSKKSLELLDESNSLHIFSGEDTDNGKKVVEMLKEIEKEGNIVNKVKEKSLKPRKQKKSDIVEENEKVFKPSEVDLVKSASFEEPKKDYSGKHLLKDDYDGNKETTDVISKTISHELSLENAAESEHLKKECVDVESSGLNSAIISDSTEIEKESSEINFEKNLEFKDPKKDFVGTKKRRVPTRLSLRNSLTRQEPGTFEKFDEKPEKDEKTVDEEVEELTTSMSKEKNVKSLENPSHLPSTRGKYRADSVELSSSKSEDHVKPTNLSATDEKDCVDPNDTPSGRCEDQIGTIKDLNLANAVEQSSSKVEKSIEKSGKSDLELKSEAVTLNVIEKEYTKKKIKIPKKRKTNEVESPETSICDENAPIKKRGRKLSKVDPTDIEITHKKKKITTKDVQDEDSVEKSSKKDDSTRESSTEIEKLLENAIEEEINEEAIVIDKIPKKLDLQKEGQECSNDENSSQICEKSEPPILKEKSVKKTEIAPPILKDESATLQESEKSKNEETTSKIEKLSEKKWSGSCELLQVSEPPKSEDSSSKSEKLSEKKKTLKRRSLRSTKKDDVPLKEGEKEKKVEQNSIEIFEETETNSFDLSENDKVIEESAKSTSKRRTKRKESVNPFDKFEIKSITFIKDPKSSNIDAIDDLHQQVICATTSKAHCVVESSIESTTTETNIDGNFVATKEELKVLTESKKLVSKSTVIEEELKEPAETKKISSKFVGADEKELIEQFETKKSAVKQKSKRTRESSENIELENELSQHDNCNEISDPVEKSGQVTPKKSIVRKNSVELINSKKTTSDRTRKVGRKRASDVHSERKSSVDIGDTVEKSKSDISHDFLQDKKPKDDLEGVTKNLECVVAESDENILPPCESFDCLEQKDNKNDQQDLPQNIKLSKTVEREEESEIIKHSTFNEQSQQKIDEKPNEKDEKKSSYEISSALNLSDVHSIKSAIKSLNESEIKQGTNTSLDSKIIKITNEKTEKSEKSKSKLSEDDSTIDSLESSQTSFRSQMSTKSIDQKASKQPHASEKVKSKLEETIKFNDSDRDKEKKPHKKSSSRADSSHKKSEKSKGSEDSRKIPTKEEKERILSSVYCPQKTTTVQESINTFVLSSEKDKKVKIEDNKYSLLYKGDKKDDPKYSERTSIHKERRDSKDIISKSRNFDRSTKPHFDKYHYYRKDKEHSKPSTSSESLKKDFRDSRDNSSEFSSGRHQSKDDKYETSRSSDKDHHEKKYWKSSTSTTKVSAPQKASEKENVSLKLPEVCISAENIEKTELTKTLSFENLYRIESVHDEIFVSAEKAIDDEVKETSELINAEIAMIQNFAVKGQPSEDHFEKSEQILNVQETIKRLNNEIKSGSTFGNAQTFVFSNYEDNTTFKEGAINIGENVIKSNVEIVKSKDKPPRVRKSRWDQVLPKEKDFNIPEIQMVQLCEQQLQGSEVVVDDTKQLIAINSENTNETKSSETKVCPLVSKAALKAYPAEISFIVSKTVAQQFENIGKRNSPCDSTTKNSPCDSTTITMADSFTSALSTQVTENSSVCVGSKHPPAFSTAEISPIISINEIIPPDSTTNILPLSEIGIKIFPKLNEDSQTSFKEDKQKPDEEKPSSPNSDKQPSSKEDSQDSQEDPNSSNIRRSHRLKSISKTKQAVGRGLVRDKERFIDCDDKTPMYISSTDLEAENAKFLKDMEERLSQFQVIKENEYRCERVISKEAKKMTCDCFLTREEEDRGELGCGEDCLNRLLMIECGPKCVVADRCTNRRFQKNLYAPCKVFRTEKKGFGIMADGEILAGEFIMEYIGEVLNDKQFRKRAEVYSKDKNKHYYFMALRSDAIIDATGKGNISRFINHSCDPNAETQKWTVNGELRIGFFSRRRITPGEEITFDYQFQRYGKEAQKCYCESANCRGWIGEEPDSDEEESSSESEEEPDKEILPSKKEIDKLIELPVSAPLSTLPLPVPPIGTPMPVPPPGLIPLPVPPPIPLSEEIASQKPDETQTTEPHPTPQVERKKQKHRKEFRLAKKKAEFLEDPDLEEEIESLTHTGLKNQAHTLRLNRLMVRGKMLATRVRLLEILRAGELPCRRLFLDYHGLRLLHGWMNENEIKDVEKELEVRLLIVQILQVLPIPNKTMLKDSKVYQTIENWANEKEILPESSPNDSPTDSGSATPVNSSSCTESNLVVEAAKKKVEITHPLKSEIARISCKLLDMWEGLPEVFRIPKRERIEQMKEHEREADRMFKALNLIDEDIDKSKRSNDRFGKNKRINVSTNIHTWVREKVEKKPKERERDILTDIDMNLTKLQRRQLFAAKVAKDEEEKRLAEERREFEIRCKFYGLDPAKTQPTDMPFYVNPATGQWFSTDKNAIETPPSHAHIAVPSKPQSTDPKDYRVLPMDLPPFWKFAIDPQGRIYYYHVKIRIPQWEPPIKIEPLVGSVEQKDEPIPSTSKEAVDEVIDCETEEEDESSTSGSDEDVSESKIRKIVKLLPDDNVGDNDNNDTSTTTGQGQELKQDRKMERYKLLVQERPISPRREEDRLYNQHEMKRYKENKEKIRKRREAMKRKKAQLIKENITSPPTSSPTPKVDKTLDEMVPLPIQDYLFSSDEEEQLRSDSTSPLLEMLVQGDKIVDELDALKKEKPLKRPLPIKEKYGQQRKRVKTDERKRSEESKESKSQKLSRLSSKYLARKAKEKFRSDIAGVIVHHLTPYRKDSCQIGRITNNEDFKHLARKLTHFVMIKELKHCDLTGQVLEVTESVKNKSREFIKKYMAKYGEIYIRPENDPEFKDIPHKD